jgi:hypothetical protein
MNNDPTTFSTVMGMVMHAEAERARQEERAAVVAWLRESSEGLVHLSAEGSATLRGAADEIERGEHRREEGA